jgi:hypothetical protein
MDKIKFWTAMFLIAVLLQFQAFYADKNGLLLGLSEGRIHVNHLISLYLTPTVFAIFVISHLINFISGKWK